MPVKTSYMAEKPSLFLLLLLPYFFSPQKKRLKIRHLPQILF